MGRRVHFPWFLLLCAGCQTCAGGALATLERHEGEVERDFAAAIETWSAAEDGDSFTVGDGLRTYAGAGAALRLRGGGKLRVESETTIRFRPSDQTAMAVDVVQGEAEIRAGEEELGLTTEFGLAVVSPGGGVRVRGEGSGRRIDVSFGAAQVPNAEGLLQTLEQGEHIEVGFGAAQIVEEVAEPEVAKPEPAPEVVAVVAARVTGEGVRQRSGGTDAWQPLSAGETTLSTNTRLDLPAGASVALQRGDEHVTLKGRGQFHVGSEAGPLVRSLGGHLVVDATASDVVIEVPGGHIVARGVEGGSRAQVAVDGEATHVEVETGRVAAVHEGESYDLAEGDAVDLGQRVVETGEGGEPGAGGGAEVDNGVAFAELVVPAGQSSSIYDPKPPTAVGFALGGVCSGGAVVRAGRLRAAGEAQVNLALDRGLHGYRVYCKQANGYAKRPAATGRIRIVRSAGTQQLPKRAPTNRVELDGRRYTVLFSNRKPAIEVHWPTAPPTGPYTVHAQLGDGGKLRKPSSRPRYTFEAGALPEGEHRVSMSGTSGERSRETTLVVRFDNAAPTASLRAPAPEGFAPGASLSVAGVVLPGSKVSVEGHELPLDRQLRFESELPAEGDRRAIAIRIEHPRTGVRYYLRRAKAL